MAGWLDEEETAVDARILDVAFSVRRELLAQISRVLILDVLDNGVPAMTMSISNDRDTSRDITKNCALEPKRLRSLTISRC
jgi:hypothetical protein